MARDYRQLAVPRVLMDRIQALMDEFPEFGYRNPSEAAIEGIRWWIGVLEDRAEKLLAARERQATGGLRPGAGTGAGTGVGTRAGIDAGAPLGGRGASEGASAATGTSGPPGP